MKKMPCPQLQQKARSCAARLHALHASSRRSNPPSHLPAPTSLRSSLPAPPQAVGKLNRWYEEKGVLGQVVDVDTSSSVAEIKVRAGVGPL